MPAFPVHGWMPDAYRQMPLPVLAVFSAVLSKVAAYGFLRVALPVFPDAAADFQLLILLIALGSILYGSVQAFTQTDARLILGYSSVAQLGFITLGIFALRPEGAQGSLLQMVQHGLVVAPLFFIIVLLAERTGGSEDLRDMGGIAFRAPVLAALFLIIDAGHARDARVGELRRGVLHPARDVPERHRHRRARVRRGGDGVGVHVAVLHPGDAQPARAGGGVV